MTKCRAVALWVSLAAGLRCQSVEGFIRGRVTDAVTGRPPASAVVECRNANGNSAATAAIDSRGFYVFAFLPPATYSVRVQSDGFQSAEVNGVTLPAAGVVDQSFALRPLSDLFEQRLAGRMEVQATRRLLRFYGPDLNLERVAPLHRAQTEIRIFEPSLSAVIDPVAIRDLPFAGRDIYSMLVMQPSATADAATNRSLGMAVNGQRPASSDFLVNGLEFHNSLISAPLVALPPEAVQEYRVSLNGFSAEFGRTAGVIANAVTRAGGATWHATGYWNLKNELLDANDFQNNANGVAQGRNRQSQGGLYAGGPLLPRRHVYLSSAWDVLRDTAQQPLQTLNVPGPGFLNYLQSLPASNAARTLLTRYAPPASQPVESEPFVGTARLSPLATFNQYLNVERLDIAGGPRSRIVIHGLTSAIRRPRFIWSPYEDFVSGLYQDANGAGLSVTSTIANSAFNQLRAGWTTSALGWARAHSEIPTLMVMGGNARAESPLLPGSPAAYSFQSRSTTWQVVDNVLLGVGRNVFKAGFDGLLRGINSRLPYGADGAYAFTALPGFALQRDMRLFAPLTRSGIAEGRYELPQFDHRYRTSDWALFFEDGVRLTARLVVNAGVRIEDYLPPAATKGTSHAVLRFGSGTGLVASLADAHLVSIRDTRLFETAEPRLAPRFGFALDLSPARTNLRRIVLRGAYGIYYDRLFDNLWLNIANNAFAFPSSGIPIPNGSDWMNGPAAALGRLPFTALAQDFPSLTGFEPNLRAGYSQHYFLGVERQWTSRLVLAASTLGSLGRRLVAADVINRSFSVSGSGTNAGCDPSRYNPCLPDISYLGSQGSSSYAAFTATASYRSPRAFLNAAYTWSHAIDNQSDPLQGDFFDLSFTSPSRPPGFSRQFDSRIDRGSADFDQRHNLVLVSSWDLPPLGDSQTWRRLTRGWRIAQIAAFRTGFPFSVTDIITAPQSGGVLLTRRADLTNTQAVWIRQDVAGGIRLLNAGAFCAPPSCTADRTRMGNTGRNAFAGPGIYNVDLSVSRTLGLPRLGESARLNLRADAMNLLNHANLNSPAAQLTGNSSDSFGVALYGRTGYNPGFPLQTPFRERGRQIQILLKLQF